MDITRDSFLHTPFCCSAFRCCHWISTGAATVRHSPRQRLLCAYNSHRHLAVCLPHSLPTQLFSFNALKRRRIVCAARSHDMPFVPRICGAGFAAAALPRGPLSTPLLYHAAIFRLFPFRWVRHAGFSFLVLVRFISIHGWLHVADYAHAVPPDVVNTTPRSLLPLTPQAYPVAGRHLSLGFTRVAFSPLYSIDYLVAMRIYLDSAFPGMGRTCCQRTRIRRYLSAGFSHFALIRSYHARIHLRPLAFLFLLLRALHAHLLLSLALSIPDRLLHVAAGFAAAHSPATIVFVSAGSSASLRIYSSATTTLSNYARTRFALWFFACLICCWLSLTPNRTGSPSPLLALYQTTTNKRG